MQKLILASASPRRADLLKQIGIESFDIIPADIDETPLKKESPKDLVLRLCLEKARHIKSANKDCFILAADSMVVVGRRILGKPSSPQEAAQFLDLICSNACAAW